MLEIRNLCKNFEELTALNNINLNIQAGEFFSLLGPSGCGKTTLLRLLAGFERPSSGEIYLDGERLDTVKAHFRPLNMVFQRYALFPHLSVWDNVAFGLKIKKVPEAELKQRVFEALDLVKMRDFASRGTQTLSGGQQQRIALARALINRPKVLLLDEPLSALDLKLRQKMQIELVALQRRLNLTFIFVTHDQQEALQLSDRIAVFKGGQLEQVGTPFDIYEYPRTAFVADFIGTVNSIVATVSGSGPGLLYFTGPEGMKLEAAPSHDGKRSLPQLSAGERIQILVRPECLYLSIEAPKQAVNFMRGVLKEIFYKGHTTELLMEPETKGVGPIIVSEPNGSPVLEDMDLEIGRSYFIHWPSDEAIVLRNGIAS